MGTAATPIGYQRCAALGNADGAAGGDVDVVSPHGVDDEHAVQMTASPIATAESFMLSP